MSLPEFEGGLLGVVGSLLLAAVLVTAARALDRRLDGWLRLIPALERRAATARLILWVGVATICFAAVGRWSPPLFWVLLPAGGLALALATSGLLRNAIAGVAQAVTQRAQPGDYVAIGETEGVVEHASLRTLSVRRADGSLVHIPQHEIAVRGLRELEAQTGGHPAWVELPLDDGASLEAAMEEARLAAVLAPHAHLGSRPTVTISPGDPGRLRVQGHAIHAFAADRWRAEVAVRYRRAMEEATRS